ncbi:hypothetical protein NDN08_005398 [Rhodosorus marinus]|uniref:Serine aminopeptidase S33 domain-containing protein n=1 Tax=Rhodosorus marinus TaxID=101924 RepID=A0AAV8V4D2_9RHOD|nr:hypothetical protein NDN08_005398 [Rhodosorus marinus]
MESLHVAFVGSMVMPSANKKSPSFARTAKRGVVEIGTSVQTDERSQLALKAAKSFKPSPFRPVWWLANHHAQTIGGMVLPRSEQLNYDRERFATRCGGFFDVDTHHSGDGKSIVILYHGLESTSRGPHTRRITKSLACRGHTVAAMNFRGCSGDVNTTLRDYHLGFTDDLATYVQILSSRVPEDTRIYLSGFSLGANVVLKFLAERSAEELAKFKVFGAAVQCVPFDPVACQAKLERGFSRLVYSRRFLKSLKKKAIEKSKMFPAQVNLKLIKAARTIADFDDAYIAPMFGFESNMDYYRKNDTRPLLSRINVPTLVVNSLDDPFIERKSLPKQEEVGKAPVKLVYTESGGHLGFIQSVRGESYAAAETARFLEHLESLHRVSSENNRRKR